MKGNRAEKCRRCHDSSVQRFFCRQCYGRGWEQVSIIEYERCWECKGVGEMIVFNPVIPKGRLV